MIIDVKKLKKYLSEDNSEAQPMIINLGTKEEALEWYMSNGEDFTTIEDMEKVVGDYYFIYEDEWYHILFEDALDVVINREENFFKPIQQHKALHMLEVANHMAKMSHKFGIKKEIAYLVGYLHDIGYISGRVNHEQHTKDLLSFLNVNDEILRVMALHGKDPYTLTEEEITPLLMCLWDADMSVDTIGEDVGYSKRLKDIKKRYGKDHIAYITASNTVKFLKENFWNKLHL